MAHLAGDFRGGLQDESAKCHTWMGQGEFGTFQDHIVIQQQIQIQRPGSPANTSLASEVHLNPIQQAQQFLRRKRGSQSRNAIQERLLTGRPPDGLCLTPPTVAEKFCSGIVIQLLEGLLKDSGTIAEIGPESNQASGHEREQQK
jgi:hypothetical protein